MLVPIGEMREAAVILTPVRTADASGGEVVNYTESDPIFVAVRSLSTKEAVQFGQMDSDINHVCFGHWAALNQLTATNRLRLLETNQEFDISGSPINDPKRSWTRLHLVSRENG